MTYRFFFGWLNVKSWIQWVVDCGSALHTVRSISTNHFALLSPLRRMPTAKRKSFHLSSSLASPHPMWSLLQRALSDVLRHILSIYPFAEISCRAHEDCPRDLCCTASGGFRNAGARRCRRCRAGLKRESESRWWWAVYCIAIRCIPLRSEVFTRLTEWEQRLRDALFHTLSIYS